jgi:hypothetical protein
MRFYVPVGPRGVVFRIGMVATRAMGSLTYWYGSRRRSSSPTELPLGPFARAGESTVEVHMPHSPTTQPVIRPFVVVVATEPRRIKTDTRRR